MGRCGSGELMIQNGCSLEWEHQEFTALRYKLARVLIGLKYQREQLERWLFALEILYGLGDEQQTVP
ncbi:hypothetical protein D3C72_1334280 [compost metagenome]